MSQYRTAFEGAVLVKTGQTLPATTTSTLFTVAGGAVLVTGLLGRVTTVCSGTATTLALGTTASSTTSIATALAVTSKAVGTWYVPVGTVSTGVGAAPLVLTGPAFVGTTFSPAQSAPFLLAPDAITWTTSATNTGVFTWYIWYIPLDGTVTVS